MLLPLSAAAIMATVLLWELALPRLRGSLPQLVHELAARRRASRATEPQGYDPGRELRAEQRARELLRSCVNEEEWAMYRDLGFLRVWAPTRTATSAPAHPADHGFGDAGVDGPGDHSSGAQAALAAGGAVAVPDEGSAPVAPGKKRALEGAPYAYLLYPHKPIVAYIPQTGALLNEYCVAFPDETRPYGSTRLPDADDVLAKWMALAADERRLIADANMHLPGRQVDPQQVREDLARLARWERERLERLRRVARAAPGSAADVVIENLKGDSNSARPLKIATAYTPPRPASAPADRLPPAGPVRSSVRPA